MTVTADGCRDYLVKRIPLVLVHSVQHWYSPGRTHTHTHEIIQRSIQTIVQHLCINIIIFYFRPFVTINSSKNGIIENGQ